MRGWPSAQPWPHMKGMSGNAPTAPCTAFKAQCGLESGRSKQRSNICCFQQTRSKRRAASSLICKADSNNGSEERSNSTTTAAQEERIKQTLAGLDALLGIDPDEELKKKAAEQVKKEAKTKDQTDVTFSQEVIDEIAKAEAGRLSKDRKDIDKEEMDKYLAERMTNIIKNARQLSDDTANRDGKRGVERDLDTLLQTFMLDGRMRKEDQQRIKDKVFDGSGFYVTELSAASRIFPRASPSNLNSFAADLIPGSTLVRGNLRGKREEVFDKVCKRLEQEFGNQYTATLILDPMAEGEDVQGNPRVAFQIAGSNFVQPAQTRQWQWALAFVLGLLTLGTAFQLGLTANISTLPKEIVEFIAQPDSLKGEVPEFVENYDALPFLLSALPITLSVLGIQSAHELGHKIVAESRKVKLGAPVFLPNPQLGVFGAITQLKSMVRSRTDLFDIAAAGPAVGAFVSSSLFVVGLYLSTHSSANTLLPVPGSLLEGSLLLGSLTHIVMGDAAVGGTVSLHPVLIAGWCGLVTTALNCLPVGSLDGGRVMLAAFGRNLLSVTSFFTYVGLGLGFLGSGLALPFGLFILLCQRDPEKYIQDTVSPTDNSRQTQAAVLITTALLVLLPMLPGVGNLGAGGINL